jgi:hypothetical protein
VKVRASDGVLWSDWTTFNINAPVDHAPVVAAADYTATKGQNIAATSLFSTTDADGDPITAYQLWDTTTDVGSGSWVVNGGAQPAGQAFQITPAQLLNTTFQSGSGTDQLMVRASDGDLWSDWTTFNVNAPVDHAPVVTGTGISPTILTYTPVSSLFSVTDADGDAIKTYELFEAVGNPTVGGILELNGGTDVGAGRDFFVDANSYNGANYYFADSATPTYVSERAYDGTLWSDWTTITITAHA